LTSLAVANAIIQSVARAAPRAAMMNIVHFSIGKLSSHLQKQDVRQDLVAENNLGAEGAD
jgi:hypothetical protein